MTTQFGHPVATTLLSGARAFEIEAGAVWDVDDRDDYTQVMLTDCDDRSLVGLTICMDWTQPVFSRPESFDDRVLAIIADADLLASHAQHHVDA